jgi:uncharacterized membrane protein (TIGR02234 family)
MTSGGTRAVSSDGVSTHRSGGSRWRAALRPRSPRQELMLALVLGAAGAGVIFLATRQGWAQVRTTPPRPLPASLVTVTGASLVPFAEALALASLASLAAVVASRRLLRRITGLLLAVLGGVLAVSVVSQSQAGAIAAAAAGTSPATAGAGSVTQGSAPTSSAIPNVAGSSAHVAFIAVGWQVLAVAGAIMLVAAGLIVLWRADRMAVMSSRYDPPARSDTGAAEPRAGTARAAEAARQAEMASLPIRSGADSASIWEALSRGDDPTAAGD